jgi:hypothetical protein
MSNAISVNHTAVDVTTALRHRQDLDDGRSTGRPRPALPAGATRSVPLVYLLYAGDSLAGETWDHRNWQTHERREELFWLSAATCLRLCAIVPAPETPTGGQGPMTSP